MGSAIGTKQTWASALHMSAFDPKRTSSRHNMEGVLNSGPYMLSRRTSLLMQLGP